jgi:hypothetical protein
MGPGSEAQGDAQGVPVRHAQPAEVAGKGNSAWLRLEKPTTS